METEMKLRGTVVDDSGFSCNGVYPVTIVLGSEEKHLNLTGKGAADVKVGDNVELERSAGSMYYRVIRRM